MVLGLENAKNRLILRSGAARAVSGADFPRILRFTAHLEKKLPGRQDFKSAETGYFCLGCFTETVRGRGGEREKRVRG